MTEHKLTLLMENLSSSSSMVNKAMLRTIFDLAHVNLPELPPEMDDKEKAIVPLTFTFDDQASMNRVKELARQYESILIPDAPGAAAKLQATLVAAHLKR